MRSGPGFVRPPAALALFALICAWTASPPADGTFRASRSARLLRADPRVHSSYVPPPAAQATPASASFVISYTGFTPEAQAAFQYAANIWSTRLNSPVPIRVEARFGELTFWGPDVLSSAGPLLGIVDEPSDPTYPVTMIPSAIITRLDGHDDFPSTDLWMTFSSTANWYFGRDGMVPSGQYDFVSAVLHELAHGLGFVGTGRVIDGIGDWGWTEEQPYPTIYDRFVTNYLGQSIMDYDPWGDPFLAAVLTGGRLFFSGPLTRAANDGAPAQLHAPATFDPVSSYQHLSEAAYPAGNPNSLMTPFLASGEAIHDPGAIAVGMLHDMGWDPTKPECSYDISATPTAFPAAGGSGLVTVTTAAGCGWRVFEPSGSFITIGGSGMGSATLPFTVAPQPSDGGARAARIYLDKQRRSVTISQAAAPCFYTVGRSLVTFGTAGGGVPVTVTASGAHCTFSTSSDVPWATISGSHTGSTTLTIAAAPNDALPRAATLSIAGHTVAVRQNARGTPALDANGDGAGDIFACDPISGWGAFAFGRPDTLGFNNRGNFAWGPGLSVFAGDFTGDGLDDLLFYDPLTGAATKAVTVLPDQVMVSSFAWSPGWQITVADLNGDRRDDVFVYNPTSGRWIRGISTPPSPTKPDGSFAFSEPGFWSPNWSVYPGDFNADGRADLFVYNATSDANHGRWFRVLSNADGSFSYIEGDAVWRNDWSITPGDYNGDGVTDLFLYRPSGEWYRVFFTPGRIRYERGVWSPGWTLSRGDFDGDLRDDLFVYNQSTGRWYVVMSEFDGSLAYYGNQFWSSGWNISVTDINVDGVADLVLYNPADGRWYQAVTRTPGDFAFTNGIWPAGRHIVGTRPQFR